MLMEVAMDFIRAIVFMGTFILGTACAEECSTNLPDNIKIEDIRSAIKCLAQENATLRQALAQREAALRQTIDNEFVKFDQKVQFRNVHGLINGQNVKRPEVHVTMEAVPNVFTEWYIEKSKAK